MATPDPPDDQGLKRPRSPGDPSKILPDELSEKVRKRVDKFSASAQKKIKEYQADPTQNSAGMEVGEIYSKFVAPMDPFSVGVISTKKKPVKTKRLPRAGVGRSVEGLVEDMDFATVKQGGKWMEEGRASGRTPKSDIRDLQLLSQLSQAMIDYVIHTEKQNTQEVEAMAVNGRVIVSANEQATVVKIGQATLEKILEAESAEQTRAKREKLSSVAAAISFEEGEELGDQERVGIDRLTRMEVDSRFSEEQASGVQSVLVALTKTLRGGLDVVNGGSPEAVAALITDDSYKGRIITIDANSKMVKVKDKTQEVACTHAEQNLVYSLILSDHNDGASIAGGKRPCTICWLSLSLAKDKGYKIRFNQHPGGYWSTTTLEGLRLIAEQLGYNPKTLKAKVEVLTDGVVQYVTDPSVIGPRDVDLREGVKSKEFITDMGSPSQSPERYPYSPSSPEPESEPDRPASTFSLVYVGAESGAADPEIGSIPLSDDGIKLNIGRRSDNDIVLSHKSVSRLHATIRTDQSATVKLGVQGENTWIDAAGTGTLTQVATGKMYTLKIGSSFQIGAYQFTIARTS